MTPVQLFTAEMLGIYLVFVAPDRAARVLRHAIPIATASRGVVEVARLVSVATGSRSSMRRARFTIQVSDRKDGDRPSWSASGGLRL